MKRLFDIVLAAIGLVVAAPLMALIALAIKIDSPGRVFFSQKRLGQGGEVFWIHKFRKFPDDWGTKGAKVTVAGDARMTRLGRVLERSKFDELPQLWNILIGEMSFVGPRPESLDFADSFTGEFARVHEFKPGIFGPNQISFRNESEMYPPDRDPEAFYREELFPAKARNDIEYFDRANLLSDLGWIIAGVWVSLVEAINWKRLIRQRGVHISYDTAALVAGWSIATLLRFDGMPHAGHLNIFLHGAWLLPTVIIPLMFALGCYRQPVRHFSLTGAMRIGGTLVTGFVIVALVLLAFVYRNASVLLFPIAVAASFSTMVAGRVYYRERWMGKNRKHSGTGEVQRVAIYGSGRRGAALAELLLTGFARVQVVGFIDDNDVETRGREIGGRPVLGSERDLWTIHAKHQLHQIWITFEPDAVKHRRLDAWCREHQVKMVVVPRCEPFRRLGEAAPRSPDASASSSADQPREREVADGLTAASERA